MRKLSAALMTKANFPYQEKDFKYQKRKYK